MTAPGAPPGKHRASVLGFHARAESVRFGALSIIRLKCTFWHVSHPPEPAQAHPCFLRLTWFPFQYSEISASRSSRLYRAAPGRLLHKSAWAANATYPARFGTRRRPLPIVRRRTRCGADGDPANRTPRSWGSEKETRPARDRSAGLRGIAPRSNWRKPTPDDRGPQRIRAGRSKTRTEAHTQCCRKCGTSQVSASCE